MVRYTVIHGHSVSSKFIQIEGSYATSWLQFWWHVKNTLRMPPEWLRLTRLHVYCYVMLISS